MADRSGRKCTLLYSRVIFASKRLFSCGMFTFLDVVKKRPPQRVQKRRNDVYVNRRTDFAAQLERCQKSLDSRSVTFVLNLISGPAQGEGLGGL